MRQERERTKNICDHHPDASLRSRDVTSTKSDTARSFMARSPGTRQTKSGCIQPPSISPLEWVWKYTKSRQPLEHHIQFTSWWLSEPASPVLRSPDLDCNQAYNFGYESTYPQPMNAILPNTASSLDVAPEFISHYPEIPSEPQSYNSQTYPTSTTTNTDHFFNQPGSITDPMNATFPDTSYSPIVAP